MKHLIIFLDYCQSRIQHPVYRQFAQTAPHERNAALLFLPKPPEERELLHEVAELRRRARGETQVCFHLCADFSHPQAAQQLLATMSLIQRCLPGSHTFCYVQISEGPVNSRVWNNLVLLNNTMADYPDMPLARRVFLDTDTTLVTLSLFLYAQTQHHDLSQSFNQTPVINVEDGLCPVFALFGTNSLSYPDKEIRHYLHLTYLRAVLDMSQLEHNPVGIATCNAEAHRILSFLPLDLRQASLLEDHFLSLDAEQEQRWQPADAYWQEQVEMVRNTLADYDHEEWLMQLQQQLEVNYQSTFRNCGVDYFYSEQELRSEHYANLMLTIIGQELQQTMLSHPYPPEVQKYIAHAIVNQLQQRAIEAQQQANNIQQQTVPQLEERLKQIHEKWASVGFIGRLRGKDQALLADFSQALQDLLIQRTTAQGSKFASKLLDELIPQLATLDNYADTLSRTCRHAVGIIYARHTEARPEQQCGFFPPQDIRIAADAIEADVNHLQQTFMQLMNLFATDTSIPSDAESMVNRSHEALQEEIENYLTDSIAKGKMPPVVGLTVRQRLEQMYADKGGFAAFETGFRQRASFALPLRNPEEKESLHQYQLVETDNEMYMIHTLQGLSLKDLDNFSGQRMFIEPSLF